MLYYSDKTIKQIRKIIGDHHAYIVPG